MTDENKEENQENPKKTLTLGSSKLKLSKPIDASKIEQSLKARSNKVTVLKKKRFVRNSDDSSVVSDKNNKSESGNKNLYKGASNFGLTDNEQSARIQALKKAAESTEIFNSKKLERSEPRHEESKQVVSNKVVEEAVEIKLNEKHNRKNAPVEKKRDIIDDVDEADKASKETKSIKAKITNSRRSSGNKINVNSLSVDDEENERIRSLASIKRAREKAKKIKQAVKVEKFKKEVKIPEIITVSDLSNRMSERTTDVIKELMKLGTVVTANQDIDADTAEIIVESFGHIPKKVAASDIENIFQDNDDTEEALESRAPVVTIMGHVDHGKTSLLDAIRSTDVVDGESGGITQHIGAYQIETKNHERITFIDTPGHEAFTAMRIRGAESTDIVIIVVAADDGIMEQTKEAINHARAANVPIIVAVNKIDKPEADPQKVRNELLQYELVPEELGGDIMVVDVSAKSKINLDKLEEAILLQAEMLALKANKNAKASGVVIESKLARNSGVLTTVLIQRGTLKVGDIILAGSCYGKVRKIQDDNGRTLKQAYPSMPVEILGLGNSPEAGDSFNVVDAEKQARDIASYRESIIKTKKQTLRKKGTLQDVFDQAKKDGGVVKLSLIIKGDVNGSIEAIANSLSKFNSDEININIIHTGVGGISKSDVILASATNAIIIGFNVRADNQAMSEIEDSYVDIRYYSIIYNLIDDVKAILSGMLKPIIREVYTGKVSVKQVFNITKIGKIAGSEVIEGTIKADSKVRVLRDNIVVHEGKIKDLKRFKENVKEVRNGQECGLSMQNFEDIKERDVIEVFEIIEEQKKL